MEKEQVVTFRDYCKENKLKLELICDNVLMFDEASDCQDLIWDDESSVFYCLKPTISRNFDLSCYQNRNGVVQMTNYDMIQYMTAPVTYKEMLNFLDFAKNKGLIDDIKIKHIKKSMNRIYMCEPGCVNASLPEDLIDDDDKQS